RTWFTRIGTDTWLHSSRYNGPYIAGKKPSDAALKAIQAALPAMHPDASTMPTPPAGKEPEVVVSTTPMCLISINGQPELVQVADGLFAVGNANCDLFTTTADNAWWLLSSGRWFTTTDMMNGPWTYAKPSALPAAFAQIDPKGSWGNVLAAVPGTSAATDALYQQTVPHVATLDRTKAKAKVSTFGGPARFKAIDGTKLQYATNASSPMILCEGSYYLCQDAAWFVAAAANGPWALCDKVPAAIYTMPPSCPLYGVTFVQVYNATPEAVTFGFTAGYMNSYENDGVVSYGTGYAYPGVTGQRDLVLGDNSDVTDDDTWDTYGGYPNTYGYWPNYGYTGWGYYGYPGWGEYSLWCAPYWAGAGWWGEARAYGVGYALGMGYGDAWRWGYHPWGWRDGNGWWNNHWSGAYRRGWDTAATGYNRAGAAGDITRMKNAPGNAVAASMAANGAGDAAKAAAGTGGNGLWHHAGGVTDDVSAARNGQVMQQRGAQTYARTAAGWQRATGSQDVAAGGQANAMAPRANDGSWRDGAGAAQQSTGVGNFQERDGSANATATARGADMNDFRPDQNHNFDGSPRGAFARGETNYADRDEAIQGTTGGRNPSTYQRGGSWNGSGWTRNDQADNAGQRYQRNDQGGQQQFTQNTGWHEGEESRPTNNYQRGYEGWSNGNHGYGEYSGYTGARGLVSGYNGAGFNNEER
ncbi:MAG: hypothetical protein EBU31_11095, partial [Proteobacteria bacterium]|nr:hypothetical protein [Pseudomonadota bacterium]